MNQHRPTYNTPYKPRNFPGHFGGQRPWKRSPNFRRNNYRAFASKPKYIEDSNQQGRYVPYKKHVEADQVSTGSSRKSSREDTQSRRENDTMSSSFLSHNSGEASPQKTYPHVKPNGHVSNPLSYDDTFRLKVNPHTILRRGVKNLHLKNIPKEFTTDDIEMLMDEKKESLILINHPFSKSQNKFLTYCFVILDDEREAANLCRKWDRKNLVDFMGNTKRMQVFQGVQLPREFLLKILKSKGILHKVNFTSFF